MDRQIIVSQAFISNPQGSRLRGRPKNRWWNFVQTDVNKCEVKNGKRGYETEVTGRSAIGSRRPALGSSAI